MYNKFQDYYKKNISFNVVLSPPIDLKELNEYYYHNINPIIDIPSKRFGFLTPGAPEFDSLYRQGKKQYEQDWNELKKEFIVLMKNDPENAMRRHIFGVIYQSGLTRILTRTPMSCDEINWPLATCKPLGQRTFIAEDGGLYACEKINSRYRLGDVFKGADTEKINNLCRDFMKYVEGKNCQQCWAMGSCSRCFAGFSLDGAPEPTCKAIMANFEEDLRIYLEIKKSEKVVAHFEKWGKEVPQ
jgi:radical SAM protein with 4Fe4S-binding SPASM domain